MLGKDQPVILQLLEIPRKGPERAQGRDDGTGRLRLPAAGRHEATGDPMTAFKDTDYACWSAPAARPRHGAQADLLAANARSSPPRARP
jgi:malate dehydrogenase